MEEQNIYVTANLTVIFLLWVALLFLIHIFTGLKWWWYFLIGPVTLVAVSYIGERTVTKITNPIIGWIISKYQK